MSKTFKISASGLKNIVFQNGCENTFQFIIGQQIIETNQILADFISPRVSHIHHADPTVNSINLNDFIQEQQISQFSSIFTKKALDQIKNLIEGLPIEIDLEQIDQLRLLSILLENDDLYSELNELFPMNSDVTKINFYVQFLQFLTTDYSTFHNTNLFDFISSRVYSIDKEKLLKFSESILYMIQSNEHLKIQNEDSLYDIIEEFFSKECNKESKNKILFYEQIEIENLSESKFNEFIEKLDYSEITRTIWYKLKKCFHYQQNQNLNNENARYSMKDSIQNSEKLIKVPFQNERFNGIITKIGNGKAIQAFDNGFINITASSFASDPYHPKFSLEYENNNYFHSGKYVINEWLCVDFKERKVNPSHYSLKSYARGKNNCNLQTWCIEGSNDEKEWKIIDSRTNDRSLDDTNASNTFEINNSNNDYYRFLRIRITGPNAYSNNDYRMIITSIEFFGTISES